MAALSIVPLGYVKQDIITLLQSELTKRFSLHVTHANERPLPHYAFNENRDQYHSVKILDALKELRKKDERILGVADIDIFIPGANFLFGETDILEGICLISLTRLRQEFYDLEPDERLFMDRAMKEAIHEVGHTYGIGHCRNPRCIMRFSTNILDTDAKGPGFCGRCRGILGHRIKF